MLASKDGIMWEGSRLYTAEALNTDIRLRVSEDARQEMEKAVKSLRPSDTDTRAPIPYQGNATEYLDALESLVPPRDLLRTTPTVPIQGSAGDYSVMFGDMGDAVLDVTSWFKRFIKPSPIKGAGK